MRVAIKELSGIRLEQRHRAAGWTKEDQPTALGRAADGAQGHEGTQASGLMRNECRGLHEISGLWTFKKGNGATSSSAVCFPHPRPES